MQAVNPTSLRKCYVSHRSHQLNAQLQHNFVSLTPLQRKAESNAIRLTTTHI